MKPTLQASLTFSNGVPKTGWPWDVEVDESIYSATIQWPRITIITPSFNQAVFLEESLRSVVFQNYPNLEYIVIDGGSTDKSVDIIRNYERHLFYWVSEKDFGQSHAINKGIYHSTGEIINWINSDDILQQESLYHIARKYLEVNNERAVLIGNGYEIDENSKVIRERLVEVDEFAESCLYFKIKGTPIQQSIFFSKRMLIESGGINPLIRYPMDIDLYNRIGYLNPELILLKEFIGGFRKHTKSKTVSQHFPMMEEKINLLKFLSFYDSNKQYYKSLITSYILATSFRHENFRKKLSYVLLGLGKVQLKRNTLYKYKTLVKKIFD
jgi:glycosyltransferase involved in cell wall biosynthesis